LWKEHTSKKKKDPPKTETGVKNNERGTATQEGQKRSHPSTILLKSGGDTPQKGPPRLASGQIEGGGPKKRAQSSQPVLLTGGSPGKKEETPQEIKKKTQNKTNHQEKKEKSSIAEDPKTKNAIPPHPQWKRSQVPKLVNGLNQRGFPPKHRGEENLTLHINRKRKKKGGGPGCFLGGPLPYRTDRPIRVH